MRSRRCPRVLLALGAVLASVVPLVDTPRVAAAAATVVVSPTVVGTTPVLGYNIAHGMEGSNAADWWRYDGAKAARVFLSVSDIEPADDISGTGDGVSTASGFDARKAALRANAATAGVPLDPQYVDWQDFVAAYGRVATGNNRFAVASWFPQLRAQGVDILVNITASPSRFPLAGATDHANAWELWQHYYAQAFLLSRDHDVSRFSMFNEPNGWTPAITVENWALRLRIASDAIRAALADMNSRYGRSLVPQILAPNTANGATKYDDHVGGDYWGEQAVAERNLDIWGVTRPAGPANFDVYNYQKYSTSPSSYATDYDALVADITADVPGGLPMALTEYNVRTGADYDAITATADSPADFAALGATSVALAAKGVAQLYLFKYGMTERTGGTYPVAKNGTHYVQNGSSTRNDYGGAAGTAEVYRLFLEASGRQWDRLAVTSSLGSGVAVQATRAPSGGPVHVFVANTTTSTANVDVDLSGLGVADGSAVVVEEVSTRSRGGVVRRAETAAGRVPAAPMPAQSVWLVTVHPGVTAVRDVAAVADTTLADGANRGRTTGGVATDLVVRSDGTADGRNVSVLRFPVPPAVAGRRVLLSLQAAATSGSSDVQAHVYGLADDTWTEAGTSFATLPALRQDVGGGNTIDRNVVTGQGTATQILGQLMAAGTTPTERLLDVTDFVDAQTDGLASFLLVQDHRWDVKLPERTTGDTQPAGVRVQSRESGAGPVLRILSVPQPQATAPSFTPPAGTYTTGQSVTISSATPGATIRYTTDGTAPSATNGTTYTGPVSVAATATIRAIASASGLDDSDVATATYTVTPPAVGTTFSREFESLTVSASSGDRTVVQNDTAASGGKSVTYRSNAAGDFVTFAVQVPAAGRYSVAMTARMDKDRGTFQLEHGPARTGPWTAVDTPKDEYRPTSTLGPVGTFTANVTFATAGTHHLRLRVTGRNAASSGFVLSADRITFTA